MAETETLTGGCLCGAVRYRIPYPFDGDIAHCHCTMCRRASGAPVVTWVTIPRDRFELTQGELANFASSSHASRGFCGACGSPITFATDKHPAEIDVTLATLDTPERFPPTLHIYTDNRLPWLSLDTHLPDRES